MKNDEIVFAIINETADQIAKILGKHVTDALIDITQNNDNICAYDFYSTDHSLSEFDSIGMYSKYDKPDILKKHDYDKLFSIGGSDYKYVMTASMNADSFVEIAKDNGLPIRTNWSVVSAMIQAHMPYYLKHGETIFVSTNYMMIFDPLSIMTPGDIYTDNAVLLSTSIWNSDVHTLKIYVALTDEDIRYYRFIESNNKHKTVENAKKETETKSKESMIKRALKVLFKTED